MKRFVMVSSLAALMLSSTPSMAAPDYREGFGSNMRNAAFIGAQARLSLGSPKPVLPVARLTAGTTNLGLSDQGALVNRAIGSSFELGLSRSGRPDFYVGGHRYSDVKAKLGIAPVGVALLAVGGLAVVGAAVAGSSGSSSAEAQQKKQPEVVCLGIGVCPPLPKPGG